MAPEDSNPEIEGKDFWHLPSEELAARIGSIAHQDSRLGDAVTRAEASRLATEWQEALSQPTATFEEQEDRVGQLDSLQRRTIEILIRTGRSA
jgi:hypothetical protein